MAKLTIIKGENLNKTYDLEDDNTLGRSVEVSITLNDLRASRKHTRIFKQGEDFYVEDMGSQNGTFLNGRKIAEVTKLIDKDKVCIGVTWLEFCCEEEDTLKVKIGRASCRERV